MHFLYILNFEKGSDVIRYVGETQNLKKRVARHIYELTSQKHHNSILQKAFNDGFLFNGNIDVVICEGYEDARSREQALIKTDMFVNIESNYDNLTRNPNREEILRRTRLLLIERVSAMTSEERKAVWGRSGELNPMYGRNHTDDTRRIISEKVSSWNKINTSPNLGIIRSDEFRKNISERAKLRTGVKNPFYGKSHTALTKERLRQQNLGKKPVNEKSVSINDVIYRSVAEAGRELKIPTVTVLWRVKSNKPKFDAWKWFNKSPETRT